MFCFIWCFSDEYKKHGWYVRILGLNEKRMHIQLYLYRLIKCIHNKSIIIIIMITDTRQSWTLRLFTPHIFAAPFWPSSPFRCCSIIFTFFAASILLFLDIKYLQVGFYILVSYLGVSYQFRGGFSMLKTLLQIREYECQQCQNEHSKSHQVLKVKWFSLHQHHPHSM